MTPVLVLLRDGPATGVEVEPAVAAVVVSCDPFMVGPAELAGKEIEKNTEKRERGKRVLF